MSEIILGYHRGGKRYNIAIVAIARKMLVCIYYMLKRNMLKRKDVYNQVSLINSNQVLLSLSSKIYPLIPKMLKRGGLVKFGDAIIMDRGFYAYKNYLVVIRYGITPLILLQEVFQV